MNWDHAIAYMEQRAPSFRASIVGIPRNEIAACEEGNSIVLPASYVEFLVLMGDQSGDFRPFGATRTHNFYRLVEQLPDEDYPVQRFFKIAIETSRSEITKEDLFLDLHRSDGTDAALVRFEDTDDFELGDVMDTGFTFDEQMTSAIFHSFELRQRAEHRTVLIQQVKQERAKVVTEMAIDLLTRMRLQPVLPVTARVAAMSRTDLSALVSMREANELLRVEIGSGDSTTLRAALDQLLTGLPGAKVTDAVRPPRM